MVIRVIILSILLSSLFSNLHAQCDNLEVDAGPDKKFCEGEDLGVFDASLTGDIVRFFWEPLNRVLDPYALSSRVAEPGTYTLTASVWDYETDLIVNGGFESGNTGFTSQYTYVSPTGPFDNGGMYGIDNSAVPYSPTGPGNYQVCPPYEGDNMLIARGTNSIGASVWCQTVVIEPQTDYHFIFLSANVGTSHPSQFNIEFNSQTFTGYNNVGFDCTWTNHEAFWYSNSNTTVEVCITSIHQNNPGKSYANAFVIDNVQMYGTCKKSDEVTIDVIDMPLDAENHNQPCGNFVVEIPLTDYPTEDNYTINWTTQDGNILSSLSDPPYTAFVNGAGTYEVELTYDDGEYICTELKEVVVIEDPIDLDAYPEEIIPISCANSRALIEATDTKNDNIYHWFTEDGNIDGDGLGTQINVTQEGVYYLVEEDALYGCKDTTLIEIISQDDIPSAIIDGDGMINCASGTDILLDGLESYIGQDDYFEWSSPDGNFSSNTNNLQVSVNQSGQYFLIITDSINLCADTAMVEIEADFSMPEIEIPDTLILDCSDNGIPSVFNMMTNEDDVGHVWTTPSITIASDTITPNDEGMYVLVARDSSSQCEVRDTLSLLDNTEVPSLDIDPAGILDCRNWTLNLNGRIDLTEGNIDLEWSTSTGNIIGNNDSESLEIDEPGWYILNIINMDNQCQNVDSVFVDLNRDLPNLSVGDTLELTCSDDYISLEGTTDFSYPNLEWGWYTSNGNILSDPSNSSIDADASGQYHFYILNTDNGCSDTLMQVLEPNEEIPLLTTTEPAVLTCILGNTNITARGVSVTGSNLSYSWTTADGRILGGTNSEEIELDMPGTYLVEIRDMSNDCTNRASIRVGIDTLSPTIDLLNSEILDCETMSIDLQPEQDKDLGLEYSWSTNDGLILSPDQSYQIEVGTAGTYQINVIDPRNGCATTREINIEEDREIPVVAIADPERLTCRQGTVQLNAEASDQGSQMYFQWKTSNGNFVDMSDPIRPVTDEGGEYKLLVTNVENGCKDSMGVLVIEDRNYPIISVNEPDSLACNLSQTNIQAAIISYNQQSEITWSTSNGNIMGNYQSGLIEVDQEGVYTIEVMDLVNGCVTTESVEVFNDPERPRDIDLALDEAICPDEVPSMAVLSIEGGRAPYEVLLNNELIFLNEQTDISPGYHQLTILDDRDCALEQEIFVPEPPQYNFNLTEEIEIEIGENLILRPQLAFDPAEIVSFQWFPEDAVACPNCMVTEFIGEESTSLELYMTTRSGCELLARSAINVYIDKEVYVPNAFSPNEDGNNDFFTIYVKEKSVGIVNYLMIYNRWGDKVFEKEKFPPNIGVEGWDGYYRGEYLNPAVFVYVSEVQFIDGSTAILSGDVTLVK